MLIARPARKTGRAWHGASRWPALWPAAVRSIRVGGVRRLRPVAGLGQTNDLGQRGHRSDIQLGHDVGAMALGRALADAERDCHLTCGQAVGQCPGDFGLSRGEPFELAGIGLTGLVLPTLACAPAQAAFDFGAEAR